MAPLIIVLSALLIVIMISIKVIHGRRNKKNTLGLNVKSNTTYYLNLSSYQWYIIRRVILFSLCVFAIFWYFSFRYFPLFNDGTEKRWLFGEGKLTGDINQVNYNKGWSMLLFLDLCTLLGLACPLVVLFDRKDKWTLAFANLGILGACMTFFGSYPVTDVPWSFNYLLFGTWTSNSDLPTSFMIHFWMLGFSLYTFLWRRRWQWQDWIRLSIVSFGYMFYVLIISNSMGITSQVTALGVNDYVPILPNDHPPYGDVLEIFGLDANGWKLAAFGLWSVFCIILVGAFPALHWIVHRYTDVVQDNNYDHLYNVYNKNSFFRWLTPSSIYN